MDARMTIAQIAEAAGCSSKSVYRVAKELYPASFTHGAMTYFDEIQSKVIIARLPKRNLVQLSQEHMTNVTSCHRKDALPSHYQMARMIEMYGRDEAARRCDFLIGYSRQYTKPAALIEEPIGPLPDFGEFFTKAVEKAHNGEKNGDN